ncbi:hypothetical protein [Thermodesulfovibrio yellowstonii]|uniref:hypothetical protein n=1 Tax=Thermodesulfovibrio yellowstonii TaxID=28262 RepID=UPI00040BFC55|nr:hypothetical protein [Thermodesulfovibrio islandicus]
MKKEEKIQYSTVEKQRLPLFAPNTCSRSTAKTEKKIVIAQNSHGEIIVEGEELNQTHRDVLDVFIATATVLQFTETTGRWIIAGNLYDVKKLLGTKNTEYILSKLRDMMRTTITVKLTQEDETKKNIFSKTTTLISEFGYSETTFKNKKQKNIRYFYVIFSKEFSELFKHDIVILADRQLLKDILSIESPFVKAVVRYILSHQQVTITFSKLVDMVSGKGRSVKKQYRHLYKKQLLENEEFLKKIGINIKHEGNDLIIEYTQNKDLIYFQMPNQEEQHAQQKQLS